MAYLATSRRYGPFRRVNHRHVALSCGVAKPS